VHGETGMGIREKSRGFWLESLKERDESKDLGVNGLIILKSVLKKWGVDWIYLAQDRDRWRTVLKTVMIFRVA
jgi:hypothetical protein